jgi:acetyltransferase-like isoleucine patch superfamily enzyme
MRFSWSKFYFRAVVKAVSELVPTPPMHCLHDHEYWWRLKAILLELAGISLDRTTAIDRYFFCLTLLEENISIGANTVIGHRCRLYSFNKIAIGKYCMFAADVTLINGGHDRDSLVPFSGPLLIGSGCWIGNGARICGPLTIGDNAIVAAGAVVTKDVPSCAIVAGVPAKVIGYRTLPDRVWHLGNTWFSPRSFESVE